MARENEGLQLLGKKTEYKMTYAPEVLETNQDYVYPWRKNGGVEESEALSVLFP